VVEDLKGATDPQEPAARAGMRRPQVRRGQLAARARARLADAGSPGVRNAGWGLV